VLVGSAIAYARGGFFAPAALAALFCALMIQIGTNFHNDVADFERGADDQDRLGPLRVTQAGLLTPRQVRWGVVAAFSAAAAGGVYLAVLAGWPVIFLGAAAFLAALAYTAGPSPLAYNGLADLFVLIFFGFVGVGGTVYVQLREIPVATWLAAASVGAAITALLVVNNIRDMPTDRRAGRRTFPVVFGRRAGVYEFAVLLGIALSGPVLLALFRLASPASALVLLMLPTTIRLVGFVARHHGRTLNRALGETARFVLVHALLLTLGIGLGGFG
jgi:1,4-dihydroxy-2-naphthoate octaprenyltransferase